MKLHQEIMPALWAYAQKHQLPRDEMEIGWMEDQLKFLYDMSASCGPNFNEAERAEYMRFRTDLTIGLSNIKELVKNGVVEVDGLVLRLHGDSVVEPGLWLVEGSAVMRPTAFDRAGKLGVIANTPEHKKDDGEWTPFPWFYKTEEIATQVASDYKVKYPDREFRPMEYVPRPK